MKPANEIAFVFFILLSPPPLTPAVARASLLSPFPPSAVSPPPGAPRVELALFFFFFFSRIHNIL